MKLSEKMKKYILIGGLVVAIGVIAFVNYKLADNTKVNKQEASADEESAQVSAQSSENFFEVFKGERNALREKEIEYIDTIINNQDTDKETLADAQQQKLALVDAMEKESRVEQLLVAKGFNNVAVTYQKGSVNVIVDSQTISDAQAAQILDIVKKETSERSENIKIMPKQ